MSRLFSVAIALAAIVVALPWPTSGRVTDQSTTSAPDPREELRAKSPGDRALADYFKSLAQGSERLNPGTIRGVGSEPGSPPPPGTVPLTELSTLRAAVCAAESVVYGFATSERVLTTFDHGFARSKTDLPYFRTDVTQTNFMTDIMNVSSTCGGVSSGSHTDL